MTEQERMEVIAMAIAADQNRGLNSSDTDFAARFVAAWATIKRLEAVELAEQVSARSPQGIGGDPIGSEPAR